MVNKVRRMICSVAATGLLLAILMSECTADSLYLTANSSPAGEEIDTTLEYSNGSIGSPTSGLALWYAWINTNDTQIIYLAYQSYMYNPPVTTFLGQHYYTQDNTEVFVGNTLTAMEVYNDTNGNGVPDVDPANGTSELLYNFAVNSSRSFEITPVEKSVLDNVPHYTWGIRYSTIDGFLLTENQLSSALVTVDYVAFSYDFYVQGNTSYLKTNSGVGRILDINPLSNASITLNGLSLSLLYGTTVITTKPYVTLVNGEQYNSTAAQDSTAPADSGEIRIGDAKAFEYLFGENYTLFKNHLNESYPSLSAGVSDQSVAGGVYRSVESVLSSFEDVLATLFPKISGMQASINLDYNVSSFLYRVCYPEWDGYGLEHDPTYIAYLNASIAVGNPPIIILIIALAAGSIALIAALSDFNKIRRMLGPLKQSYFR